MLLIWIAIAAAALAGGGVLQTILDRQSRDYQLNPSDVVETHPAKTLLTVAPGGLRAPVVSYLWIRAEKLKQAGRHHEAMQLADFICRLQPNFAGVWIFHAWNMAWNISVSTHTPEERWLWVYNGVKLLRDQGIPQNRKALGLYKELGWIFYNKMGENMDDMHMAYKQQWALEMQRLLAAPPIGSTEEVITAFRPIAEARLDKDLRRQGKQILQSDQLENLQAEDPQVAAFVEALVAVDVDVDENLLDIYNRTSQAEDIQVVRPFSLPRLDERDKQLSNLINDTDHVEGRDKLLAFLRAQILWNVYKLDPEWMLQLMIKYGPLDWRLVQPHGLYWATYGLHVCENISLEDIDSLNTDRIVMFCLIRLTANGRLSYFETGDPNAPSLSMGMDWRFIDPAQEEFIHITKAAARDRKEPYESNILRSGHINYLAQAISMLYAGYRREKAGQLLEWIQENYHPEGPEWDMDLEDFVIYRLSRNERPIPSVAISQIGASLQAAFLQRLADREDDYRQSMAYALRVYNVYQDGAPQRTRLPDFRVLVRNILMNMLVRPSNLGMDVSLLDRAQIYAKLDDPTQRNLYDIIAPPLRPQCQAAGIDFDAAFPAPPGTGEYRQRQLAPERSFPAR